MEIKIFRSNKYTAFYYIKNYHMIFHRTDGPAVIRRSGKKQFWIHGVRFTEKSYWKRIRLGDFV